MLKSILFYGALATIAVIVTFGGGIRPFPEPECGPDPSPLCASIAARK